MTELSPITIKLMQVSQEIIAMRGLSSIDHCLRDEAVEGIESLLTGIDNLRDSTIQEYVDSGCSGELVDHELNLIGREEGRR